MFANSKLKKLSVLFTAVLCALSISVCLSGCSDNEEDNNFVSPPLGIDKILTIQPPKDYQEYECDSDFEVPTYRSWTNGISDIMLEMLSYKGMPVVGQEGGIKEQIEDSEIIEEMAFVGGKIVHTNKMTQEEFNKVSNDLVYITRGKKENTYPYKSDISATLQNGDYVVSVTMLNDDCTVLEKKQIDEFYKTIESIVNYPLLRD